MEKSFGNDEDELMGPHRKSLEDAYKQLSSGFLRVGEKESRKSESPDLESDKSGNNEVGNKFPELEEVLEMEDLRAVLVDYLKPNDLLLVMERTLSSRKTKVSAVMNLLQRETEKTANEREELQEEREQMEREARACK